MKRKSFSVCLILLFLALSYVSFLWLKSHRSPQLMGKYFHRVNTSEKVVALTFDDGPSIYTKDILDILRQHDVKATFFILGKNAVQYPLVLRQIHEEGHEIGNHSFSHEPLIFKSLAFIRDEIDKTDRLIRQSGYQGPIHFRAPYGRKLLGLPWILYQTKRIHVLFDVIPDDWASPSVDKIVNRIVEQTKPGSIILCHDGNGDNTGEDRLQTVQAMPIVIQELKKAGYRFLTITELLKFDPSFED
jgi:peptidoglycan-N-acetylglucosamine deacetylase